MAVEKECYTWGIDSSEGYKAFKEYAKERAKALAKEFTRYREGKIKEIFHSSDWKDDLAEEFSDVENKLPKFDGLYKGVEFLHTFEEYVVNRHDISNDERNAVLRSIYSIAFMQGYESAHLTDSFFEENNYSFAAFRMYKILERLCLQGFYCVSQEIHTTYSYLLTDDEFHKQLAKDNSASTPKEGDEKQ